MATICGAGVALKNVGFLISSTNSPQSSRLAGRHTSCVPGVSRQLQAFAIGTSSRESLSSASSSLFQDNVRLLAFADVASRSANGSSGGACCTTAATKGIKKGKRSTGAKSDGRPAGPKRDPTDIQSAKYTSEDLGDNRIKVKVEVTGADTSTVFDRVLGELSKTAPPVPGFRLSKGGKTLNVPKNVMLNMLGEKRVRTFVVDRIVNGTLATYVDKAKVKTTKDAKTTQSTEELLASFEPGKDFSFDAVLDVEPAAPAAAEEEAAAPAVAAADAAGAAAEEAEVVPALAQDPIAAQEVA